MRPGINGTVQIRLLQARAITMIPTGLLITPKVIYNKLALDRIIIVSSKISGKVVMLPTAERLQALRRTTQLAETCKNRSEDHTSSKVCKLATKL